MMPSAQVNKMSREVLFVKALHHHYDGPLFLIVEARHKASAVPVNDASSGGLRHRVFGFKRIVDDDKINAAASQCASNRGGITAAAGLRHQFRSAVLCGAHAWKQSLVPRCVDHHTK